MGLKKKNQRPPKILDEWAFFLPGVFFFKGWGVYCFFAFFHGGPGEGGGERFGPKKKIG